MRSHLSRAVRQYLLRGCWQTLIRRKSTECRTEDDRVSIIRTTLDTFQIFEFVGVKPKGHGINLIKLIKFSVSVPNVLLR
jgi:hypothetical protein